MDFDTNLPIYLQIMTEIKRLIITGTYKPSQKIPSVRELAIDYGVNPNTVQRALSELEREGLVASERTSGRFLCDDIERIQKLRVTMMKEKTDQFLREIHEYGFDEEELMETIRERLQNGKSC